MLLGEDQVGGYVVLSFQSSAGTSLVSPRVDVPVA